MFLYNVLTLGGEVAMAQLVEWSPIDCRVGSLQPDSSWPYVDVSLNKTLNPQGHLV